MSRNFFTSIDLQQNELLNGVIHKSATAPSSPVQGQIYYDTVQDKLYVYDGSAWNEVGSSQLTVDAGSSSFVSITDGVLSFHNLAITDVTVDTTYTDLATFVATEYTVGNEFQEGDMIILTNATDQTKRSYIHNGGTAVNANDFTRLQTDLDMASVRAEFVGGSGLTYTEATGTFDVNVDDSTVEIVGDNIQVKDAGITEAKLHADLVAKLVDTHKETIGDGSTTSYTVTHNFGTTDYTLQIFEISTGECMECNIVRGTNSVTIGIFPAPALNDVRVLVQKL